MPKQKALQTFLPLEYTMIELCTSFCFCKKRVLLLQQDRVPPHLHFVWVGLHFRNGHGSGLVEATLSLGHFISLIFYKRFSYFGVRRLEYSTVQVGWAVW